ncbi:MAG: arginine--tRNA ligase [Oscillospiraceae bacterium]|nr:arginine--tRNA ligase [Oscillospiraceae bacterium]
MNELKKNISAVISSLLPDVSADDIMSLIAPTPDSSMGDFTVACFKLAKSLRKPPIKIAGELMDKLNASLPEGISKIEALNGYLNFYVSDKYIADNIIGKIISVGNDYGKNDIGNGKTMVIDYSSPNIAKPFHIGHLGTTAIGNSIKRIHQFSGYKCIGINHLGDWGTQFGRLIVAYHGWGNKEAIEKIGVKELARIYAEFYVRAESDPTLNDKAREEFSKLEHGDKEALDLWKWFKEISLNEFMRLYKVLGIEFESYSGESFYYDKMQAVEELQEKGLLKESDGAMIVPLDEYKMPPCLILKKDGTTLYATRDITAAIYRWNTYHFDKCLYVTDAGQSLYFAQWFKVIGLMGYEFEKRLVHVPYGKISVNGAKLATRTGNVVLLEELFDEAISRVRAIIEEKNPGMSSENKDEIAKKVGLGAVIFNQLSAGRIKDVNFVWEDVLNFDGNTGPYAQYTYARCCSVVSKCDDETKAGNSNINNGYSCAALNEDERALALLLASFPDRVIQALGEYEPSDITRFIIDLCQTFNRFYHNCPVINAESDIKRLRADLCRSTKAVLGNALWLIGLKQTERV